MSRDRGTQRQKIDFGYGAVCDADGNVIEGLVLAGANQEHGIVSRMDGKVDPDMATRLPIGRGGFASCPTTPARPLRSMTSTTSFAREAVSASRRGHE